MEVLRMLMSGEISVEEMKLKEFIKLVEGCSEDGIIEFMNIISMIDNLNSDKREFIIEMFNRCYSKKQSLKNVE